jgi:hypothetical protein
VAASTVGLAAAHGLIIGEHAINAAPKTKPRVMALIDAWKPGAIIMDSNLCSMRGYAA